MFSNCFWYVLNVYSGLSSLLRSVLQSYVWQLRLLVWWTTELYSQGAVPMVPAVVQQRYDFTAKVHSTSAWAVECASQPLLYVCVVRNNFVLRECGPDGQWANRTSSRTWRNHSQCQDQRDPLVPNTRTSPPYQQLWALLLSSLIWLIFVWNKLARHMCFFYSSLQVVRRQNFPRCLASWCGFSLCFCFLEMVESKILPVVGI